MTDKEYEQKRNKLWYEYTAMLRRNCAARYVFDQIFNRAYALGRETETIVPGILAAQGNGPADEIAADALAIADALIKLSEKTNP